jgi:ABC-type multidrug transport system permease subunit
MPGMDAGDYTFVLDIPPNFQRDVLAGRAPAVQLNVDATRMSQAFTGNGYIQQIVSDEVTSSCSVPRPPAVRRWSWPAHALQPNLEQSWFGSLMEIINNVTMLSIILTGAALIREREHGTIEHLLVMPVTPAEIMLAKVWSMGLVVALAAWLSLLLIVRGALQVPIEGSLALFMLVTVLHLFATTSMGIFMATLARSMPQFGMLTVLVLLPLQLLSGGSTPRESMPYWCRTSCWPRPPRTSWRQGRPSCTGRRPGSGLAATAGYPGNRPGPVCSCAGPVQEDHQPDGVMEEGTQRCRARMNSDGINREQSSWTSTALYLDTAHQHRTAADRLWSTRATLGTLLHAGGGVWIAGGVGVSGVGGDWVKWFRCRHRHTLRRWRAVPATRQDGHPDCQ